MSGQLRNVFFCIAVLAVVFCGCATTQKLIIVSPINKKLGHFKSATIIYERAYDEISDKKSEKYNAKIDEYLVPQLEAANIFDKIYDEADQDKAQLIISVKIMFLDEFMRRKIRVRLLLVDAKSDEMIGAIYGIGENTERGPIPLYAGPPGAVSSMASTINFASIGPIGNALENSINEIIKYLIQYK